MPSNMNKLTILTTSLLLAGLASCGGGSERAPHDESVVNAPEQGGDGGHGTAASPADPMTVDDGTVGAALDASESGDTESGEAESSESPVEQPEQPTGQQPEPPVEQPTEVVETGDAPVVESPVDDETVDDESEDPDSDPDAVLEDIEDIPIPASANAEDIRAIQGQQAMLKAEARLRKMLADGEIEGVDKLLTFEEISSWVYRDGLEDMPPEVKALDGKTVMMIGFMLPINKIEDIDEFLLVQSLWACCYGQPPDLNGIVRVVMTDDNTVDYQIDPVRMVGKFKIEAYEEDGFVVDIFQLHTDKIALLR